MYAVTRQLMQHVIIGGRSRPHSPVKADPFAAVGKINAEDGPIFPVQCGHPHTSNVLVHPGCSLAGLHMVRHCPEGA